MTPLPECRFPSSFAGCLLASARAVVDLLSPAAMVDSTFAQCSSGSDEDLIEEWDERGQW